jgi:hypothetical protein
MLTHKCKHMYALKKVPERNYILGSQLFQLLARRRQLLICIRDPQVTACTENNTAGDRQLQISLRDSQLASCNKQQLNLYDNLPVSLRDVWLTPASDNIIISIADS